MTVVLPGGQLLLYIADTVLQPLHLEFPGWLPIYDIIPEKAAVSKKKIFDRAADEHALVLGQHFPPFPSLGYVRSKGLDGSGNQLQNKVEPYEIQPDGKG